MTPAKATPESDPSWHHYRNTVLEIFTEPPITLDLRKPIPPDAFSRFCKAGIGPQFAVITACNPHGRASSEEENRQRTAEMRAYLEQRGDVWVRADGVSPDGLHREEGAAIGMRQWDAPLLARHFEQSAFFWYDGEIVWLHGALVKAPPVPLPQGA